MSENVKKTIKKVDLVIVGGGPGGYVAGIRASQLGMSVIIIEKEKMGGVCLNWGCIPTKALLQSAHLLDEIRSSSQFGIKVAKPEFDFKEVIDYSRKIAEQMASGVEFLMKKNKVEIVSGTAKLIGSNTLSVANSKGEEQEKIEGKYIIISTGARPRELPFLPFDHKLVLSSRDAMNQKTVPKTLAIIGAGAIGIEFADIYSSLGAQVTIIESLPNLLPNEDIDISKGLERAFKKKKIEFYTGTKVLSAKVADNVELEIEEDGKKSNLKVDKVIVGIGVIPNTENIGLEAIGIKTVRGFVDVDKYYRTTVSNIYAIGDCIPTPQLAHVASSEGIRAVEDISIREGNPQNLSFDFLNYSAIPGCTYCHPEVASVGLSEAKAIGLGHTIDVGKFPFTANGKARAMGDSQGFVKLIIESKTKEILGAHILGTNATELINEYTLAMNSELRANDIARSIHAHPTISEALMEAAEAALGHPIHI